MDYKFIARLHFIETGSLNKGKRIFQDLRISNNSERVKQYFKNEFFITTVGTLEMDSLLQGCYIYAIGNKTKLLEEIGCGKSVNESALIVDHYLALELMFSTCLWLVKDCSVNTELGFCVTDNGKGEKFISSNYRISTYSNAMGEFQVTKFDDFDLSQAMEYLNRLFDESFLKKVKLSTDVVTESVEVINGMSRFQRAFNFLKMARSQMDVTMKITIYCTILEAFLTTDNNEVTHKIAERTARILGQTLEQRKVYYEIVKNAYAIRSSAVHGSLIPKRFSTHEKIIELSARIDQVIREFFRCVISDKALFRVFNEYDNNQINHWFNDLVLG